MVTGPARVAYPDLDEGVSRLVLARMTEASPCAEHWKILITAGTGFFADAYDLFIVGVAATLITSEWHIAGYQKSLLSSLALLTSAAGRSSSGGWPTGWGGGRSTGFGGDYPVSATIMSECASRHDCGRMVALVFSMQGAGLVVGPHPAAVPAAVRRDLLLRGVRPEHHDVRLPGGDLPGPGQDHQPRDRRGIGKLGAFAGTYALTALLPAIGLAHTSGIVAGVAVLGLLVMVAFLPEPKGLSLEELTETGPRQPARGDDPENPAFPGV